MTYIIAEAGSNHCGEIELAEELILEAKSAGADAVKFQAFKKTDIWEDPENHVGFESKPQLLRYAKQICDEIGIDFLCTPFSLKAFEVLDPLVDAWKIASCEAGKNELVQKCIDSGKPTFISMGLIPPSKVSSYVSHWGNQVTPLHCVVRYPSDIQDYALRQWLDEADPLAWGLSDHSLGMGVALSAIALGASIYERHFKLFSQPASPDSGPHALIPSELRNLIELIREAEEALDGSLVKPLPPKGRKLFLWDGIG